MFFTVTLCLLFGYNSSEQINSLDGQGTVAYFKPSWPFQDWAALSAGIVGSNPANLLFYCAPPKTLLLEKSRL